MKTTLVIAALASLMFTLAQTKIYADGPFENLARHVPSTTNTLFVMNVEKAFNTPLARQKDWALRQESAFESGLMIIPPKATHFMLASEIDLEFMEPKWEIAVADIPDGPKTKDIAVKHGTSVDNIQGKPSVPLSADAYVVRFGAETYGAIAPANRQTTARWIKQTMAKKEPSVSPYLRQAVGYLDRVGTDVVLAIDLTDLLSPDFVHGRLVECSTLKGKGVDCQTLSKAVASVRGLTMGILIDKGLNGRLKVDFAEDISALKPYAKQLLLEALGNTGAMIDDFKNWECEVTAHQISLSGGLSETGGRQVMSVVDARTSSFLTSGQSAGQGADPQAEATIRYFKSINILLADLESLKPKTKTWGQKAMWYDRYARKMEALPMLNVDEHMLDYGQYVSFALREASTALKGIGARSRYRQVNMPLYSAGGGGGGGSFGYGYGPRGLGWSGSYNDNRTAALQRQGRERTRIRTEEKITGTSKANAIMLEIEKATATVRRTMTEKFKIQF